MSLKYSKEILEAAVRKSRNVTETMRNLGINNYGGGMARHIAARLKHYGIDTAHFLGKGSRLGSISNRRIPAEKILIWRPIENFRTPTHKLKRALKEVGVEEVCSSCRLPPEWNGKKLVLEIDHINGVRTDDRRENLRFLCPNCHSQARMAQG